MGRLGFGRSVVGMRLVCRCIVCWAGLAVGVWMLMEGGRSGAEKLKMGLQ